MPDKISDGVFEWQITAKHLKLKVSIASLVTLFEGFDDCFKVVRGKRLEFVKEVVEQLQEDGDSDQASVLGDAFLEAFERVIESASDNVKEVEE